MWRSRCEVKLMTFQDIRLLCVKSHWLLMYHRRSSVNNYCVCVCEVVCVWMPDDKTVVKLRFCYIQIYSEVNNQVRKLLWVGSNEYFLNSGADGVYLLEWGDMNAVLSEQLFSKQLWRVFFKLKKKTVQTKRSPKMLAVRRKPPLTTEKAAVLLPDLVWHCDFISWRRRRRSKIRPGRYAWHHTQYCQK